jgi:hypothetical protein
MSDAERPAGEDEDRPASPERPRAPRAFAFLALATAALAAIVLPGERPGLGVLVVGLAVAAITAPLARPPTPWAWAFGAVTLGLGTMVVLRGAEWLVVLDLAAALGLGVLALLGSARWGEIAGAGFLAAARAPRAPGFLIRSLAPGPLSSWARGLRTAAIAAALLLVFGSLFAAADAAFAELAEELVPSWNVELLPARLFAFVAVSLLAGTLALLAPRYAAAGPSLAGLRSALGLGTHPPRRLGRLEWVVPLALLDLLFLVFVAVQGPVLFGGKDHVLSTGGLTFAEYARQGFFQLLAVGALTLGVVAAAARWAGRKTSGEERLLRVLLGILCAFALVVLVSALRRLALYEDAFGLTLPRLVAHEMILWIGGLLVLVAAAGATLRAGWLPRAAVLFSGAMLLIGSISNPEQRVAAVNLERFEQTEKIDLAYLATLGPDALPELAALPPRFRACVLPSIADRFSFPSDGLWGWNRSRAQASDAFREFRTTVPCRPPAPAT